MSRRYARVINAQAEEFRDVTRNLNNASRVNPNLGNSSSDRLQELFGNIKVKTGYESNEHFLTKFNVDDAEAGRGVNPDYDEGVNLNYGHENAPNTNVGQAIATETNDKPLQGAPNIIVPAGSLNNPTTTAREPADVVNYPTHQTGPGQRDGGGFGNFDREKNNPQRHREAVGSYLQDYRRGQADNFGNSTN